MTNKGKPWKHQSKVAIPCQGHLILLALVLEARASWNHCIYIYLDVRHILHFYCLWVRPDVGICLHRPKFGLNIPIQLAYVQDQSVSDSSKSQVLPLSNCIFSTAHIPKRRRPSPRVASDSPHRRFGRPGEQRRAGALHRPAGGYRSGRGATLLPGGPGRSDRAPVGRTREVFGLGIFWVRYGRFCGEKHLCDFG